MSENDIARLNSLCDIWVIVKEGRRIHIRAYNRELIDLCECVCMSVRVSGISVVCFAVQSRHAGSVSE